MSFLLRHYRSPWDRTIDPTGIPAAVARWWRQPHRTVRFVELIRAFYGRAPGSCAYAFTVFVTWWTLRGISPTAAHRLILSASTNLHNMRQDPVQVLVASAFWTEGGFPWSVLATCLTVMALAEGWLGTVRWITAFAVGHIGATLAVATGLAFAEHRGLLPVRATVVSDVGASYGFSAVFAVLTFHLGGRLRVLWASGLLAWAVHGVWHGQTFADYGHLTAVLLGFCWGALAVAGSHRLERARDRAVV
ncbi:rhomboid-like protein [Nocardia stercoris]|uniref:Rhomboid family intramembrane serine protease n=1 Tax=Nocardia stercoris TaxID=2483361 RepID=A0A3M2KX12_9NOCA|nr:rhomboid-like protein [Nocardia stercoris]RMI30087.1 hypothetical protein EBN03_22930 [Nocardia stercoris]